MTVPTGKPPRAAHALLQKLAPPHLKDSALGDYIELFEGKVEQEGRFRAGLWYWGQAGHALLLSLFWGWVFLLSSIRITWRNFKRHKDSLIINLGGLAVGISCCILMLLWIQDELSWDRFHENSGAIYRISQKQQDGHLTPVTPDALAVHLKATYPEVVNAVRFRGHAELQLAYGVNSFTEQPIVTDPAFFDMFSFRLVKGHPRTALSSRNAIVVTETVAGKLFDREDPIGKIIRVNNRSNFQVTGVLEDIPSNSTIRFGCLLPFQSINTGRAENNWLNSSTWSFVQLDKGAAPDGFAQKIKGLVRRHDPANHADLFLYPLTSLHLRTLDEPGPLLYVVIFSAMAVFVLLIACFNTINLTTARSANRAREIGLRKVLGARRGCLVKQFFGESLGLSFTAVIGAVLLAGLLLPAFNDLSGKTFSFGRNIAGNLVMCLGIMGIAVVTGGLTGIYPALYLSSFEPAKALKASIAGRGKRPAPTFRRILVTLQFSLSIFLMIGTLVIDKQLHFIRNRSMGFDRNLVIYSDSTWSAEIRTIKQELLTCPGVESVSFVSQRMGQWESGAREDVKWEGRGADLKITFEVIFCDQDFLKVHGMVMAQGRFFSKDFPADQAGGFVLNEAAVRQMGFGSRSPIGEKLSFWENYEGHIIGVVKDFHTQSLHNRIQPVILAVNPKSLDNVAIRVRGENLPETLKFISAKWSELNPGLSFSSTFLDDMLEQEYRSESATAALLRYFTFLGIIIASVGLLGLVSYITRQRTREIGLRRVLGASVASILRLISREFILLLALSNVIAFPLAYAASKNWLNHFAYRTDIGAAAFVAAGGLALIIACLTILLQAMKTALADPARSLRHE